MSLRAWCRTFLLIATLLAIVAPASAVDQPDEIPGLAAWYRADGLDLSSGANVERWPDASGQGRDLTSDNRGIPGLFKAEQLNGLPAVTLGAQNGYAVSRPMQLRDHTVALVYRTRKNTRALFRGGDDARSRGIVLHGTDGTHRIQNGGDRPGQLFAYAPADDGRAWRATVLTGRGGALSGFVDGSELSVGKQFEEPLIVSKMFELRVTQSVRLDADGLSIAEMIFYDRALSQKELFGLQSYLAWKYGLELASQPPPAEPDAYVALTEIAQLTIGKAVDVNGAGVPVPWDEAPMLDPPFDRDPTQPSRLICLDDGVRVRLSAHLPLISEAEGTNVRLLFRVNGAVLLRGGGYTGRMTASGAGARASVRAEVVAELNAGDYVEVVAWQAGDPGAVKVDTAGAVWIAETR